MTPRLLAFAGVLAAQAAAQSAPSTVSAPVGRVANYVDVEGGLGYSTNPYLTPGKGSGHAFVRGSVRAVHTRVSARTSTTLSAFGEDTAYPRHFGSQKLLLLNAHHDAAVTERLRVFGDLTGSLDQSGRLGTRFLSLGPVVDPSTTPLPSLSDTQSGFVASSGRTYRFGGQVGGQLSLSAIDLLTGRLGADRVLLRGTTQDTSYNSYLASVAYARTLNARASVGGIVGVQLSNYKHGGNATVFTPQISGRLALSDHTDLSGAIGVSFASIKRGGIQQHVNGLALNARLCHTGESAQLCAVVSRLQAAETIAGLATTLSGGITYSKTLDAKQTVQLSASGNRTSRALGGLSSVAELPANQSYLAGSAAYTRRISSRLYSGANFEARKFYGAVQSTKADLSASVFLRLRLGDR